MELTEPPPNPLSFAAGLGGEPAPHRRVRRKDIYGMKRTKLMTVYSVFWFIFGPLGVIGCTLYLFEMSYVIYGSLGMLFGILASVSAFGVLKMKRWAMRLPVFAGIFHLVFLLLEALPDIVPPDIKGNLPIIIFWVGLDVFTVFYFLRKSVADRFLSNLLTRS